MTGRAQGLLLLGLLGTFAGAIREQPLLALLSLSCCLWIALEWYRLQVALHAELPRVHFERRWNDRGQPPAAVWAGRKVRVEIRLNNASTIRRLLLIRDVVPDNFEVLAGPETATRRDPSSGISTFFFNDLRSRLGPSEFRVDQEGSGDSLCYYLRARAAGRATLPGFRIVLEDPFGLFRVDRFVACPDSLLILPDYYQSAESRPAVKRHNSLPRHGIHRLHRAGSGSELLELREYVPGDPPKAIAWKVSARRGRLMTREYESEVPVRVNLLIDGTVQARTGGYGRRLIDQLLYAAASIAKASTAVGDPIGGMLLDERGQRTLPWLSGDRGFLQLLKQLAEFADHPLPAANELTPQLMKFATSVCYERFPELLDRRYQLIPFALRSANRQRRRIAGVLAEQLQLTPRQQVECYYDDGVMATFLSQWLHSAGVPWTEINPSILANAAGAGKQNVALLERAISRAVAHARDNEVFVLLADMLSFANNLSGLTPALKLAIAKHHRVAVVCPTPTFHRPGSKPILPASEQFADLLLAAERSQARETAARLKRELTRLGVAVAFSGEQDGIRTVLNEIGLARDGRVLGVR